MVITLCIFVSKSVKLISDRRKLPHEEALWLVFGSGAAAGVCAQVDRCSPGKATSWAHKAAAAPKSCKKGACIHTLGIRSSQSRVLETGCFTFWFTLEAEYNPRERGLQFGRFCFRWAGAYQRHWGACGVTSVVTGCDMLSRRSHSWPSCGCSSVVFWQKSCPIHLPVVFVRRSKCEMTEHAEGSSAHKAFPLENCHSKSRSSYKATHSHSELFCWVFFNHILSLSC